MLCYLDGAEASEFIKRIGASSRERVKDNFLRPPT
jgi:hypothetical protein